METRRTQRLPHALLLNGPAGMGKHAFAARLAQALLCAEPDASGVACGHCHACRWCTAGTHPDLRAVIPEMEQEGPLTMALGPMRLLLPEEGHERKKLRAQIVIEQVRALGEELALTRSTGEASVAIISPAERMNIATANALLKTLEEPAPGVLLILIAERPGLLLPTLRSRCQALVFSPDASQATHDWLAGQGVADAGAVLAATHAAPLAALTWASAQPERLACFSQWTQVLRGAADPLDIAALWAAGATGTTGATDEPAQRLGWLTGWIADLIRCRQAGPEWISQRECGRELSEIASRIETRALFAGLERAGRAQGRIGGPLNVQLLMEDVLLPWAGLMNH
jgi:DNA polymerase-3 subunit delta'